MKNGDIYKYNDYELLYYARENSDVAFGILLKKYSNLIRSKVSKLHIPKEYYDDYFQEGCMALLNAIKTYDENKKLPFTSFFEIVLKRHLISVLRKDIENFHAEKRDDLDITIYDSCQNELIKLIKEETSDMSDFEKYVYEESIIKGRKPSDIAGELKITPKQIYNARQRIIQKLRNIND